MIHFNKRKVLAVLLMLLLLICTYLRENIAVEINALIKGYTYNEAQFYFFDDFLSSFSQNSIILIKWGVTFIFSIVFLLLTTTIHYFLFKDKKSIKIIIYHYVILYVVIVLGFFISKLINVFDVIYPVLHNIIGYVFSPLPLFVFILLFLSDYKTKWIRKKHNNKE